MINDENNTNYGVDENTGANTPDTIKYDTRVLKPDLCDYAEAYILVDDTIRGRGGEEFINYMLKGKTLLDYTNLFSPNDFKKNDRVIKRIFKNE